MSLTAWVWMCTRRGFCSVLSSFLIHLLPSSFSSSFFFLSFIFFHPFSFPFSFLFASLHLVFRKRINEWIEGRNQMMLVMIDVWSIHFFLFPSFFFFPDFFLPFLSINSFDTWFLFLFFSLFLPFLSFRFLFLSHSHFLEMLDKIINKQTSFLFHHHKIRRARKKKKKDRRRIKRKEERENKKNVGKNLDSSDRPLSEHFPFLSLFSFSYFRTLFLLFLLQKFLFSSRTFSLQFLPESNCSSIVKKPFHSFHSITFSFHSLRERERETFSLMDAIKHFDRQNFLPSKREKLFRHRLTPSSTTYLLLLSSLPVVFFFLYSLLFLFLSLSLYFHFLSPFSSSFSFFWCIPDFFFPSTWMSKSESVDQFPTTNPFLFLFFFLSSPSLSLSLYPSFPFLLLRCWEEKERQEETSVFTLHPTH